MSDARCGTLTCCIVGHKFAEKEAWYEGEIRWMEMRPTNFCTRCGELREMAPDYALPPRAPEEPA